MRLNVFDYFRGLAIIFIVAGHSILAVMSTAGDAWVIDSIYEKTIVNLIMGGTALFVFISGYLFHHVFYSKFDYGSFLFKKIKFVFVPYLILSCVAILYFSLLKKEMPYVDVLLGFEPNNLRDYLLIGIKYIWTGRVLTAYWYIPFIMLVFVLSPLIVKFIRFPLHVQVAIILCLASISLFVHRPVVNLSPVHSLIYFIPYYLIGIVCSIHHRRVEGFLKGKGYVLSVMVVGLALAQAVFFQNVGNFYKPNIFLFEGVDIMFFQKTFMCFLLLSVLANLGAANASILKGLAAASFAIYFLHPWVLAVLGHLSVTEFFLIFPGMLNALFITIMSLVISLLVALLVRAVLRKRSRLFIGW